MGEVSNDTKTKIKALTKRQREVFDQICVQNDGGHPDRTLGALVELGLVEKFAERNGPWLTCRYSVPLAVHMEWAALCSEEVGDEESCTT